MAAAAATSSLAIDIVVPNINAANPGPSNQGFPFNTGDMRYQQVFAAGQFGGQSGFITGWSYRVDESAGGAFGSTSVNMDIWLSHTTMIPQGLSTTFDNNHGGDKTLVFSGSMNISSAGNPSFFDVFIDVNDTFFYNGTGNLILEIKKYNSTATTQLDAAGTGLGSGGTAWTDRLWAAGAGSLTGSSEGDDGMVTQFHINPVPEPGTMVAVGAGIAAFAARKRRK
jgi:hypothetical protein